MQALEGRAATGSRQTMIRNLANPEMKEGQILREVFPQDQLDDVLKQLDIASEAQAAQSFVSGGSPTTETLFEAGRQGAGINANEVAGVMSGSPADTINVASKLIGRVVRSKLTDAERARIAEMLVSTDPQLVRNAIVDESGAQRFAEAANAAFSALERAGRTTATSQAAPVGGDAFQSLLSQ